MIRLLADENLDNTIIRGLLRRNPDIDIVRVQDIGLSGEDDREHVFLFQRILKAHKLVSMEVRVLGI